MATQTPNFNFDLRESSDIFNPLSTNANFESLDTILKNLQESGGITTYTTTASANLLKLSGTPKVNDTVFKFVAAGDANTWTAATGGVVNNIVALDGNQVTIKSGNMYVAWVNSANAMVCVAWPDVVDAQTFDGKGPAEWATKVQLDAVNTTAGNAVTTAQAAATVANNAKTTADSALEAAESAGGFSLDLIWNNGQPSAAISNGYVYQLTKSLSNYKLLYIVTNTGDSDTICFIANIPKQLSDGDFPSAPEENIVITGIYTDTADGCMLRRGFYSYSSTTLTDDSSAWSSDTSLVQKTRALIPIKIYGVK